MKTKIKNKVTKTVPVTKEKEFDTVKFFRAVKEKISKDTWGLSFEEFQEYFRDTKATSTVQ